jgi:hypothetical protein
LEGAWQRFHLIANRQVVFSRKRWITNYQFYSVLAFGFIYRSANGVAAMESKFVSFAMQLMNTAMSW